MAIRTQVTALVLLTSSALFACTAGSAGDGSAPAQSGSPETHESPVSAVTEASQHRGRPFMPVSAGRMTTTAVIAHLLSDETDAGTTDGGSETPAPNYPATVSVNGTSFAYGAPVTITYGGMAANNPNSWVGIAHEGSPATEYSSYVYTDGALDGQASALADLPPGRYVARAYFGDDYTIKGESAAFDVLAPSPAPGSSITVANGAGGTNVQFGGFETIHVSFSGLAANTEYQVGVFYEFGSNSLPYSTVAATTNAEGAGSADLGDLLSGIAYDVRVFDGSSWKLWSGSSRFRVNPAVRAVTSSLASGPIEIEFAGMQGLSFFDKVELANVGGTYSVKKDADWYWSGKLSFDRPAPGSYVAKVYDGVGDTTTARATTLAFEVQ